MKVTLAADRDFIPASHENAASPGVWKKVLAVKEDFQVGHVQMVNWARLPVGRGFAAHFHEDMQEYFILVGGQAEMLVDSKAVAMGPGDAVLVDAHEVHAMRNVGSEDVEYVVFGVAAGKGGRTIVSSPSF